MTAFNSAGTIAEFLHRIVVAVEAIPQVSLHQVVLVDDCSTDQTFELVHSLIEVIPMLRVLRLSRNRGQQIAASAGLAISDGDLTLIIDDDGQNPIGEISSLVEKCMEPNVDIVIATSKHQKLGRRITSKLFWSVMRSSRINSEPEGQLMMRVLHRRVVDAFNRYPESTRTVYGITRDIGFVVVGHPVKIAPHLSGKDSSRYSFLDRFEVFIDTYLTSARKPFVSLLRASLFIGLIGASVLLVAAVIAFAWHDVEIIFLLLVGSSMIVSSVLVFFLAILIRLLSLIYLESRHRPLYHVIFDSKSEF